MFSIHWSTVKFDKVYACPLLSLLILFRDIPLQPLVLLMEWPDASNFACLISGYFKLFVDPKRTIYFRTPGQSQLTKAGMSLLTSIVHLQNAMLMLNYMPTPK